MTRLKQRVAVRPDSASVLLERFTAMAAEGSRPAGVCADTLKTFIAGEPVTDRHFSGCAGRWCKLDEAETITQA
jgi:hypothetical protein